MLSPSLDGLLGTPPKASCGRATRTFFAYLWSAATRCFGQTDGWHRYFLILCTCHHPLQECDSICLPKASWNAATYSRTAERFSRSNQSLKLCYSLRGE